MLLGNFHIFIGHLNFFYEKGSDNLPYFQSDHLFYI